MSRGVLSWALPLCCTVLGYGLAGGFWKQANLSAAHFCVLFVAVKTFTNWAAWGLGGRPPLLQARSFLAWAMLGQLLNGLAWIGYFRALSEGPAAIVQTITAAYTALAAALALLFLRERVVPIQVLGIVMVISATVMLNYTGEAVELAVWLRDSVATMFLWAAAVTVFKHAYNQEGAHDGVFFITNWLAMCLTMLPYGLYNIQGQPFTDVALGLLIVSLYCIGDLTLFAAIHRGPASVVSPLSGLYPLPTIAYCCLVLKETISRAQWTAVAMVLVAIVLIVPEKENPVLLLLGKPPKEESQ